MVRSLEPADGSCLIGLSVVINGNGKAGVENA